MIKPLYFIIFFLIFSGISFGQSEKIDLIGTLETEDQQLIAIKLSFTVDVEGKIKGTSITDFYGPDRTVSEIEGELEPKKRLLTFTETNNISTRSDANPENFCFIQVRKLSIRSNNSKNIINGKFTGHFPDGQICAEGNIYLVGTAFLENLPEVMNPNLKIPKDTVLTYKEAAGILKKSLNTDSSLGKGDVLEVPWKSDSVRISLLDSFLEDGDKINIYVNGELVKKALEIKETWQNFTYSLDKDNCTIRIEAENEGSNPPNTVNVRLVDQDKVHPFITRIKKGESITIIIKREL